MKKVKNKYIIAVSLICISIGLIVILSNVLSNKVKSNQEKQAIKKYYNKKNTDTDDISKIKSETEENNNNKINYIAVLRIPKINLERGLVLKNSIYNNVKYNVEILDESDSPDVVNGNVILAAHSGNARYSFFRNLYKLNIGDSIIIDYSNKSYLYKVVDIYDVEKTGTINLSKKRKSILTLITCRQNTNKQIVITSELQ